MLEKQKGCCWWRQWLYIRDPRPNTLYIAGNGFVVPEQRWTFHIACLMGCHSFFQKIIVAQNLTENLTPSAGHCLGSHSPLCMYLLALVPPTWQHLFMLLPKSATCYMWRGVEISFPQSHTLLFHLCFQSHAHCRELMGAGSSAELKAPTPDHHAQRELCTYERQSVLLWDFCSAFKTPIHTQSWAWNSVPYNPHRSLFLSLYC